MNATTSRQTADLVNRSRRGDTEAFSDLVQAYQKAACATALSFVPDLEDARDLAQDAFVEAYTKLAQLQDPQRFGGWLRTIVRRRALNWKRHRQVVPFVGMATSAAQAAVVSASGAVAGNREEQREVLGAVQQLPEGLREVVLMHYMQRASYREIARILGVSPSTVNSRLRQARQFLRHRLSRREEWKMSSIQEEVTQSICQIAREEIQQQVHVQAGSHLALFCGVDTDVELCHTQGDQVLVTGTKVAIGQSAEAAQANVAAVELLVDQVDSFIDSGPHPGEIGIGTDIHGDEYVPTTKPTDWWRCLLERGSSFDPRSKEAYMHDNYRTWGTDQLYDEMSTREAALFERLRADLAGATTRLSLVRERADYIMLSREHYSESIRRVFTPTNTYDNLVHGPSGQVEVVIALPPGVSLTVFRPRSLKVTGLRSDLNVVEGKNVEIEDVEGNLCLLNTQVVRAEKVRGDYLHSKTTFGGAQVSDSFDAERSDVYETRLKDIVGRVQVDLGRVALEAIDLHGDVDIRNRFGTTRYHLNSHRSGSRYHIEADSGEVRLFVREKLAGRIHLTLHSLCGRLLARGLKSAQQPGISNCSTDPLVSFTTRADQSQETEFYANTRDGDIIVEKTS